MSQSLRAFPMLAMLALLGALVAQRPAFAQTTGSLVGTVFDAGGNPLAGVRVTVESPTQIGGAKVTHTNDEGRFRFVGLSPGTFTLQAVAPKLKPYKHTGIVIRLNQQFELDVIMDIETVDQEIVVVEKAPDVNVTKSSIGESYDKEFLDSLPLRSRDYQGVMALAPGVRDRAGTGNPNVRGGSYFNNSYTVDGFQTTDPVTHTFGNNFSFDAMAAVEVQTAGLGAENASTTGGLTNIVTKSGSNKLEIDTSLRYSDQNLRFFEDARDRGRKFRSAELNLNIGGPVVKDRLWYFVSVQGVNSISTIPLDPTGQFPEHPPLSILGMNAFGKLTWQATARNKLELKLIYSPAEFNNLLQSPLVEPEAEARSIQSTRFIGASWNSVLTDRLVLVSRAGFQEIFLGVDPQSCQWDPNCSFTPGEVDLLTGVSRGNFTSQTRSYRRTFELSGHLEWFKDTKRFGSHAVRFSWTAMAAQAPFAVTVPGDRVLQNLGPEPFRLTEVCSNDPRLSNGECRSGWLRAMGEGEQVLLSLSDTWKPTRYVTVRPGLAFHRGFSETDLGKNVTDITTFTPHLAVTWDATHDGRTAIRAAYNQQVDVGFLALASLLNRQLASRTCDWDPDAKAYIRNCRSTGGEGAFTVGLPCGPDGRNPDGSSCRTSLRAPRTHEIVMSAEREVITGVVAGGDFVYRKFVHQWEDTETNAIWNRGGTGIAREGGYKNGRPEYIFDLGTPDAANRRYISGTAFLRKRQGLFRFQGSYTLSKSTGANNDDYISLFLDNPGQAPYYYGALPDDSRHDIRVLASYSVTPWLSLGTFFGFESGGPYNRYGWDPVYGGYSYFYTKRGYDYRGTVNPDDDTPLRLPDLTYFDLQANANLKPLIGHRLEVFADLFNLLSLRTTTNVIQADVPTWGQQIGRLSATRVRLGVRYRF